MNTNNILLNSVLDSDSYKFTQPIYYPEGMENLYSYIEARGGKYDSTMFFGLQIYLKEYLSRKITQEMVEEAKEFIDQHIGLNVFNYEGWSYIATELKGELPLLICAVAEGSLIPNKNVLVTIQCTDPKVPWLTSFVETSILRSVWFGSTVATISYNMRQTCKKYLEETADNFDSLPFSILDFGARGANSFESAGIAACANLSTGMMGSDTITGNLFAKKYYNAFMPSYSVRATEHSVMTSYGKENEYESLKRILELTPDGQIISIVLDSWDCFTAAKYLVDLKDIVISKNLQLVCRPDSGEPSEVLPKLYKILEDGYGHTINVKGYKILNNVKLLWGDGISPDNIFKMLDIVKNIGYSTQTIMLGCGGKLVQENISRSTLNFAMKASAIEIDEVWKDICKDPVTDPGKQSKKGRVKLYKDHNENKIFSTSFLTREFGDEYELLLIPVFKNGKILREYSFDEVRQNSEKCQNGK